MCACEFAYSANMAKYLTTLGCSASATFVDLWPRRTATDFVSHLVIVYVCV